MMTAAEYLQLSKEVLAEREKKRKRYKDLAQSYQKKYERQGALCLQMAREIAHLENTLKINESHQLNQHT